MPDNPVSLGSFQVGIRQPLLLIAGPCVLQEETSLKIADALKRIIASVRRQGHELNFIFKGSFDKANRTGLENWRGTGLENGLAILKRIRKETGVPVTTDIHETIQAEPVGKAVDLIQIPAFLSRQTDLLIAAAKTGLPVHVKKGQFMSPYDMKHVLGKLEGNGCSRVLLGERGTFFGYGQLVNDFRSLVIMRELGAPVVFDATHSVQKPGGLGSASGGNREFVVPLARAAVAVGIDALFLETHFNPEESPCDGPNMIPLDQMEPLLLSVLKIRETLHF
ncbi:MAG: 3-deoxy-8-phosphooctulonate synthase [Thermoguttaceae bacterium]|nr:3-deoxy-8-phosphooctulonate synthase [Thermoguttaceae bacterium]